MGAVAAEFLAALRALTSVVGAHDVAMKYHRNDRKLVQCDLRLRGAEFKVRETGDPDPPAAPHAFLTCRFLSRKPGSWQRRF